MLQGVPFASKWRPYWTSSRFKSLTCRLPLLFARPVSTPVASKVILPSSTEDKRHPAFPRSKRGTVKEASRIIKDLLATKSSGDLSELIRSSEHLPFFSDLQTLIKVAHIFARSSTPVQSLNVLKLIHDLGYPLTHKIYESVCKHLWAAKEWDCILAVTLYARRHTGCTSSKLLNWRATALMETKQYSLLQGILQEFKDADHLPDQATYHLLMTGCIRNHDLEGLKRYFQDMKAANFSADATTHTIISKSYWRFGADIEVRRSAMENIPKLERRERMHVFNNLLQFSMAQDDLKTVLLLLSMLDSASSRHMASFVSPKSVFDSSAILGPKIDHIQPDSDTYAIFMNHRNQENKPEEAICMWERAAMEGLSATPNVLAALIHAYFLLGHGNTALKMIAGISVNSQASTTAFQSLALTPSDQEGPPTILNLPCGMLSTRTCNVLLKALLKRQGLSSVSPMFAIMHSNHLKANERTLELILSHLNHTEEPRPRTLFQVARKLASSDRTSSEQMHNIISCILRDEKRLFIDSAWKPPVVGFRHVKERRQRRYFLQETGDFDPVAGLGFGSHLSYEQMARPILHSLNKRGVKIDPAITFLRMRRDAMLHLDVDSAIEVFRSMLARGLRPTAHHFCALIEGYALSGDFSSAYEIMAAAKDANIKPNLVMYTTLIAAYAKHRDSSSAMRVFNEMVSAGIRPDVPSIDALVSAFYSTNDGDTARQLLRNLWHWVEPFPETLQTADLTTLSHHFRTLHAYRSRGVPFEKARRIALYTQLQQVVRAYNKYFGLQSSSLTEQDRDDGIVGK